MKSQQEMNEVDARFDGVKRLYGEEGFQNLQASHVCVIGLGGVGSWAVEALARSGVGNLTLVDGDVIVDSNINRQLHALNATLGQGKAEALKARIEQINPACIVSLEERFLTPDNVYSWLSGSNFDYVIDAIDDVPVKTILIAYCRQHKLGLLTAGSAGGKSDPTKIQIIDLSRTEQEPLLARVRKLLRADHQFPRGRRHKFGIDAVFSSEPMQYAETENADEAKTSFGTSMAVTAGFGLAAASHVLAVLAK